MNKLNLAIIVMICKLKLKIKVDNKVTVYCADALPYAYCTKIMTYIKKKKKNSKNLEYAQRRQYGEDPENKGT